MLLTYLIYYIALVMTLKGMRRYISQKINVLGQACDAVTDPGRLYHLYAGNRCNGNPISTFPPCYAFQISTELFHKQSWGRDSEVNWYTHSNFLLYQVAAYKTFLPIQIYNAVHMIQKKVYDEGFVQGTDNLYSSNNNFFLMA